jgi:DNA-binding CsgD family transcriptional regulator
MRFDALRRLLEKLQASGKKTLELEESAGNFTDSELAFGRLVLPLLEDMDAMKRLLEDLSRRARAMQVVLDRLPVAALVLDAEGSLLAMNSAARAHFGGPAITSAVLRAARRALKGDEESAATVDDPLRKGGTLRLVAADVAEEAGGGASGKPSVVFVVSNDSPPPVDEADLVGRFDLTKAEASVVALVAHGLANREVGESMGISVETVRSHLASAFRKTGARNRAGLAALAYGARFGQGPISGAFPPVGE